MDQHPPDDLSTVRPAPGGAAGEAATLAAPPFRAPVAAPAEPPDLLGLPLPGQKLGDFELISVLGTGAFARVYLARQVSLGRQVALKVSRNRGQEARTLAQLEHDHIVHIFSEVVESERDLRLLCMQYVPGTTLEKVLEALAPRGSGGWDGRAFLEAVDALSRQVAPLDLAALRDRELLADSDNVEAGCWLGARLAEALAHAHALGVLHRDVKPANVLVNRYGRPLLADFNVASRPRDEEGPMGGTLAYMAPEHLDAMRPDAEVHPEAVDARADVYSLGVVLFQLFAGRLPFDPSAGGRTLAAMAEERRAGAPRLGAFVNVPPVLERVVARCLAPSPADRFAGAAELAEALESARQLRRAERELPPGSAVTRLTLRYPFGMAALLILFPHFLGSVVNVSYNFLLIVDHLTDPQKPAFATVCLAYNALFYPLCISLFFRQMLSVFRAWRRLAGPGAASAEEVAQARRRALRLPRWGLALSCLGWLPGGLLFPLGLSALAGRVSGAVYVHFLVSFTISGLIALTYSVLAIEFVALRVLYPRLWAGERAPRQVARAELAGTEGRLRLLQFLAVLIPLAGAGLMLGVGPEEFDQPFRLLVSALLAVGTAGLGLALLASAELGRALAALTGREVKT